MYLYMLTITETKDSPGGPVVRSPPSSAGDLALIPGRGTKVPHAVGQLSLQAATTGSKHPDKDPVQPK